MFLCFLCWGFINLLEFIYLFLFFFFSKFDKFLALFFKYFFFFLTLLSFTFGNSSYVFIRLFTDALFIFLIHFSSLCLILNSLFYYVFRFLSSAMFLPAVNSIQYMFHLRNCTFLFFKVQFGCFLYLFNFYLIV